MAAGGGALQSTTADLEAVMKVVGGEKITQETIEWEEGKWKRDERRHQTLFTKDVIVHIIKGGWYGRCDIKIAVDCFSHLLFNALLVGKVYTWKCSKLYWYIVEAFN